MATLEARGFVSRPQVKEGAKGAFSTYTLAVGQKDSKTGKYDNVYMDCVDFKSGSPPEDGSRVQVTGYFTVRKYPKKDGTEGTGLNLNVQSLEVLAGPTARTAKADAPDPARAFDDIPF